MTADPLESLDREMSKQIQIKINALIQENQHRQNRAAFVCGIVGIISSGFGAEALFLPFTSMVAIWICLFSYGPCENWRKP